MEISNDDYLSCERIDGDCEGTKILETTIKERKKRKCDNIAMKLIC
jgi:hypothetical protein